MFARVPFGSTAELAPLWDAGIRIRHVSEGWALVEASSRQTRYLPSGSVVIAPVRRDMAYAWVAAVRENVADVDVLMRWRNRALVGVRKKNAEYLHEVAPPHGAVPLGDWSREALILQPKPSMPLKIPAQRRATNDMMADFSFDNWQRIVNALAENDGVGSRFTFRTADAQVFDGSPQPDDAIDRATGWIAGELESYGYDVKFDQFRHVRFANLSSKQAEYGMQNVVATKRGVGDHAHRTILMTAHYDSVASRTEGWDDNWRTMNAPGADDNASGVATVLEAARLFGERDFDFTVTFVLFSGEEIGLFGSKHYADQARQAGEELVAVVNTDMMAYEADGNLDLHAVVNRNSEWILDEIERSGLAESSPLNILSVRDADFVFSDHAPFWAKGYSAIFFSEESEFDTPEFNPHYHSVEDLPETLNPDYAAASARFIVETTAMLARIVADDQPLGEPPIRIAAVSVYPNPFVAGESATNIQYQLNRDADTRVEIFDLSGRRVYDRSYALGSERGRRGLNEVVVWDGRNVIGERVAQGQYFVSVTATDADGIASNRVARVMTVPDASYLDRFRRGISASPQR